AGEARRTLRRGLRRGRPQRRRQAEPRRGRRKDAAPVEALRLDGRQPRRLPRPQGAGGRQAPLISSVGAAIAAIAIGGGQETGPFFCGSGYSRDGFGRGLIAAIAAPTAPQPERYSSTSPPMIAILLITTPLGPKVIRYSSCL